MHEVEKTDPDKKWIRTWNDYLQRIKYFFRWLYNYKANEDKGLDLLPTSDWITPIFVQIKEKRTKRISPYAETELWERDEILTIIKYEPYKRNKAISLLWDLNARNHEVTMLKIKHIRLRERYGEGEIPHESKTGTGPILFEELQSARNTEDVRISAKETTKMIFNNIKEETKIVGWRTKKGSEKRISVSIYDVLSKNGFQEDKINELIPKIIDLARRTL